MKELTDEQIAKDIEEIERAGELSNVFHYGYTLDILKQLQSERAKKDDVWNDAPEWAGFASVRFQISDGDPSKTAGSYFTRTLPKTLEQEIAEKYGKVFEHAPTRPSNEGIIKMALEEYKGKILGELPAFPHRDQA